MPINNPFSASENTIGRIRSTTVDSPPTLPNQAAELTLTLTTVGMIYRIETSTPARFRLYRSQADLEDDYGRGLSVEPRAGGPLLLELVTSADRLRLNLSPVIWINNDDEIYYALLTNRIPITTAIGLTLEYIG